AEGARFVRAPSVDGVEAFSRRRWWWTFRHAQLVRRAGRLRRARSAALRGGDVEAGAARQQGWAHRNADLRLGLDERAVGGARVIERARPPALPRPAVEPGSRPRPLPPPDRPEP